MLKSSSQCMMRYRVYQLTRPLQLIQAYKAVYRIIQLLIYCKKCLKKCKADNLYTEHLL